jgi:LasA protease
MSFSRYFNHRNRLRYNRPMNSALHKAIILLVIGGMFLSACGGNLWGTYDPTQTPTPTTVETVPVTPDPTPTNYYLPVITTQAVTPLPSVTVTPQRATITPGTPRSTIFYYSQSGDSLEAVALHFGVDVAEISSSENLPTTGFINPGTLLLIFNLLAGDPTTPAASIMPDSEVLYSPSAQSFDIQGYVSLAGGKLNTYREYMSTVGWISGAEGIRRMALGSSISPRMLLALVQYYTGWVQGQPNPGVVETDPLGYHNPQFSTLYQQLRLMVRELLAGYYGWRDGSLSSLTFPDGSTLRLAPNLNAGTVALQYMFSRRLNQTDWLKAINPDTGFPAFFANMFGDPWERAREYGPLFPPNLAQPTFILPFEVGVPWTFTSGPHPAWDEQSALAALDFAPPLEEPPCESSAWVVAIASGLIVRSEDYYVVLDLDGDGFEQTGWVVLYQHITKKDRIKDGIWVTAGDRIGHPSCQGGSATGANLHIARKYNGEWVPAGDPLPFVLSGWTTHAGSQLRQGTLTKGNQIVTASLVSEGKSNIIRKPGE